MKSLHLCLVILVVFFVAFGCKGGKELTRGKAAELIKAKLKGDTLVYDSLPVGEFQDYSFAVGGWGTNAVSGKDKFERLQQAGYATINEIAYCTYRTTLTPKIEPYILARGQGHTIPMPFSRTYYYSDVKVLLFEKKFKSVTGLTKSNPLESPACDLTAEFTYAIEFSPFAHLLSNNLPGQVSNSRACFKLYDDGWRLLEIDS